MDRAVGRIYGNESCFLFTGRPLVLDFKKGLPDAFRSRCPEFAVML